PRPLLQLRRLARPHHDLVAMLQESARQRLRNVARTEHSDFHGVLPRGIGGLYATRRSAATPVLTSMKDLVLGLDQSHIAKVRFVPFEIVLERTDDSLE